MIDRPFVGIAGNIGAGKTTLAEVLSKKYNWEACYESVTDNPYLDDFYNNMQKWSFHLQIYFLYHRFSNQSRIKDSSPGLIQDRTIYEDVEIFARNLYEMNLMSNRDWATYKQLFNNMVKFLKKPDLIIYLKASTDTLLSRIKNRNRNFEKEISPEYIHSLNILYEKWIYKCKNQNILIVNSDKFNVFTDKDKLRNICVNIERKLIK